jgi:hypothetical protein
MTNFYRLDKITLTVLAQDHDDAANILGHGLTMGLGQRPDADFDVVEWRPRIRSPRPPPLKWLAMGCRGFAWPIDDSGYWELVNTDLPAP